MPEIRNRDWTWIIVLIAISLASILLWLRTPFKTAEEIDREQLGVSILAVSLHDITNIPSSKDGLAWNIRYDRITTWMKDTQTYPDIIALQDAPGFWDCSPSDKGRLTDYKAIDYLLKGIREASGEQYRIAYLITKKPHFGNGDDWIVDKPAQFCTTQGGQALLYRPSRLRNVNEHASGIVKYVSPYNSEGIHDKSYIARSIQCCQPTSNNTCEVIDGDTMTPEFGDYEFLRGTCATHVGVAWTRNQYQSDISNPQNAVYAQDAVFSRFELVTKPGNFIHIYNVHRSWEQDDPDNTRPGDVGAENINQLVTDMEKIFSTPYNPPLYTPILVGNFNIGNDRKLLNDYFPNFKMGMWGPEVMGALIGKVGSSFLAKRFSYANLQQIMPKLLNGESCDGNHGADTSKLWSSHCGIFFRIEPSER